MDNLNWRWKRIIVCAVIGAIIGLVPLFITSEIDIGIALKIAAPFLCAIGLNLFYWGWIMTNSFLHKLNLFVVMSGVKWLIYYFCLIIISGIVGYIALPMAIVKAVKNVD